jgi:pre-mRNA-splicing helicase BRR2
MSEKVARFKQYEYRANSNLVLQAERDSRPRESEPTGEPETLWGKISGRMGDRAQNRQRDQELIDKLDKMRKRQKTQETVTTDENVITQKK